MKLFFLIFFRIFEFLLFDLKPFKWFLFIKRNKKILFPELKVEKSCFLGLKGLGPKIIPFKDYHLPNQLVF